MVPDPVIAESANPIDKARKFVDLAYSDALNKVTREYHEKYANLKTELLRSNNTHSGGMVRGYAALEGWRTQQLLQARIDAWLEAYELYDLKLGDTAVGEIVDEVMALKTRLIMNSTRTLNREDNITAQGFGQLVESHVHIFPARIHLQIERRRMAQKKTEARVAIHLHGHNSRINVNSVDNSKNSVTMTSEQVFSTLRQEIAAGVEDGKDKDGILRALSALEKSQGSSTMFDRYSEFISSAADYMSLIAPFIPALTEMLHNALK